MLAAPGAAGQGEVVGMPRRQRRGAGEGSISHGGSPQPGHGLQNTGGGNNAGFVRAGYFGCIDKSCAGLNDIK